MISALPFHHLFLMISCLHLVLSLSLRNGPHSIMSEGYKAHISSDSSGSPAPLEKSLGNHLIGQIQTLNLGGNMENRYSWLQLARQDIFLDTFPAWDEAKPLLGLCSSPAWEARGQLDNVSSNVQHWLVQRTIDLHRYLQDIFSPRGMDHEWISL